MIFFSRSENQINIHDYLQNSINNSGDLVKDLLFLCKDGYISSYQLVFASLSDFLQSEFKMNTHDNSISILLPDFNFVEIAEYLLDLYNYNNIRHEELNKILGCKSLGIEDRFDIEDCDGIDINNENDKEINIVDIFYL